MQRRVARRHFRDRLVRRWSVVGIDRRGKNRKLDGFSIALFLGTLNAAIVVGGHLLEIPDLIIAPLGPVIQRLSDPQTVWRTRANSFAHVRASAAPSRWSVPAVENNHESGAQRVAQYVASSASHR